MPARGAGGQAAQIPARAGETVLDAIVRSGVRPYAPCAGRGICGKCRVVAEGELAAPTDAERERLTREELAAGVRLACQARIAGDVTVHASGADTADSARILLGPDDPRRGQTPPRDFPKSGSPGSGVALDIGTTTLVAYLVDLATERIRDAVGALNPQAAHGADLISRIVFSQTPGGAETLQREVVQAADGLVRTLLKRQGVPGADIGAVSAVGNTCMHHLFLGIPASSLGVIPYTAAVLDTGIMPARTAGLTCVNPEASFFFLPNIAGFLGSDALAVALVAKMDERSRPTLAIDIGTNGEIILAAGGRLLACSAAAGPAFEGVNISSGMIAAEGAIDWANLVGEPPRYDIEVHVIGDVKPRGICGSGLISIVAALRKAELISEAGAFELDAVDQATPLARRVVIGPSGPEFVLSDLSGAARDSDASVCPARVALTQRDIRELQLAKAAIRAGAEILLEKAGISPADLDRIVLAGAFGAYLDKSAAQALGLLPNAPRAQIASLGNAAGEGAVMAVANPDAYRKAHRLAGTIEHVELAASPEFMQVFADSMLLAKV